MRLRHLLLLLILVLVLIIARLPASLLDTVLIRAGGALRLVDEEGTVWSGHGRLASRDPDGRHHTPWLDLAWHLTPSALLRGELAWKVEQPGLPPAEMALTLGGMRIAHLELQAPASAALSPILHPLAQAGWNGDLHLNIQKWRCDFSARCSGNLVLDWNGAASMLFPGWIFGDYTARIQGTDGALRYELSTRSGRIRLEGRGALAPGGRPSFDGAISGDPLLLQRLPNVAGNLAVPTSDPGRFLLKVY